MKALRFVITPLLLLCMALTLQAQNRRTVGEMMGVVVNGCIYGSDELESKPYGLPNASIHMTCLNDTSVTLDMLSTKNGQFSKYMYVLRKRVKKNDVVRVRIKVSYLGYETFEKDFSAVNTYYDDDNPTLGKYWKLQVDSIVLQSQPVTIQEAQIVGELQRMYESGDTTVFNVDAYQMPRGTVLLNLVRRLPGLRYEQGQLTYRDSVIHEIRLNGESFFAHDMKMALENIENADLKQFRVYRTQADTMSTDTTKHWVADMITKKPANRVEMAKPEVGTSDKKDTYHIAMEGMKWNSGNKGEWSASVKLDDLPDASMKKNSQNSISGSYRRKIGQTNISYQPRYTYNDRRDNSESLYSTLMPGFEQYSQSTNQSKIYSNSTNHNLTANGMIGEKGGFWNTNIYYSNVDTRSHSQSTETNYSGDPYGGEDNQLLDEQQLKAIGLNRRSSQQQRRSHLESFTMNSSYSKYFEGNDKHNSSVSFNMDMNRSRQHNSTTERQQTDYLQYADSVWSYHRQSTSPVESGRLRLRTEYSYDFVTKRVRHYLRLGYEYSHNYQESELTYHDLEHQGKRIDSISTYTKDLTDAHRIGINYNFSFKRLRMEQAFAVIPTRNNYHYERRDGVQADTILKAPLYNSSTRLEYQFAERRSASIEYSINSRLPNASNLVRPTSNDDPLYISIANPNLKKPVNHNISLFLSLSSEWSISNYFRMTRNNIASRNIFNTKTGGVTSTYDNINGSWSMDNHASYRTDFKHANITVDATHQFSHNVNYLRTSTSTGEEKGTSNVESIAIDPRFMLYTKHYDLSLNGRYSYQWGSSDYTTNNDKIHTFQLNSGFNYWLGTRLTLHSDLNLSGQAGSKMEDANRTDIIWNLGVEYKVLRDHRGLLKLQWFDILQQRRTYSSYITSTGRSEYRSSGNPHYVLLTFQYKLYKMK